MNIYPRHIRLKTLQSKGGMMFFTIERPNRIYRGTILLSPVRDSRQKRAVYIKEYRKPDSAEDNTGGQDETL